MPPTKRADALFSWIEHVHGPQWGDVLDGGTGAHSLAWLAGLEARSLTAVTVEKWRLPELPAIAPGARIVEGQWTDPALLAGESFDEVLLDYVLGAVDGHAPYFQYALLERIRPLVRKRLYLVGLEPPPRDGSVLDEVCRVRDAAILLAGDRTYREYPRELVIDWLGRAGFRVVDARVFPNRLGPRFINGQLDVAVRKLPRIAVPVREALGTHIEALRARALERGEQTWGEDYVIAAEVR